MKWKLFFLFQQQTSTSLDRNPLVISRIHIPWISTTCFWWKRSYSKGIKAIKIFFCETRNHTKFQGRSRIASQWHVDAKQLSHHCHVPSHNTAHMTVAWKRRCNQTHKESACEKNHATSIPTQRKIYRPSWWSFNDTQATRELTNLERRCCTHRTWCAVVEHCSRGIHEYEETEDSRRSLNNIRADYRSSKPAYASRDNFTTQTRSWILVRSEVPNFVQAFKREIDIGMSTVYILHTHKLHHDFCVECLIGAHLNVHKASYQSSHTFLLAQ